MIAEPIASITSLPGAMVGLPIPTSLISGGAMNYSARRLMEKNMNKSFKEKGKAKD
jgi:hypothetical protein